MVDRMKVLLEDGAGSFVVRTDEGDVPPGMETVRIVGPDLQVSPARKLGSAMAMMDPDDWRPVLGVPPTAVLEAVRRVPG
jgi:hypothetical protein